MNDVDDVGSWVFITLMFVLGGVFGGFLGSAVMKNGAIEHNCAIYAPDTGNFTWVDPKVPSKTDDK